MFFLFLIREAGKKRTCELPVEEIYQRSHEKCRYDSAGSGILSVLGSEINADRTDQDTDDISAYTNESELPLGPVGDDYRDRIISRYAEIRRHIK